ncbi:MAG: aspartate--tRNA(Asn) ligase [Agathobacter rectalis]
MEFLTGAVQKEDLGIAEILAGDYEGKSIKVKGAIHTIRDMGEVAFIVLRRRDGLVQCVYEPGKSRFSVDDLKEADTVEVCGTYKSDDRSPNGFELRLDTITILSEPAEPMPLQINKWKLNTSLEAKLNNRAVALRNPRERATFRIQEGITRGFRDFLYNNGFTDSYAKAWCKVSRGRANLFKLEYFHRPAILQQSPQFYKQMMVGVFDRVFETAPVFRAEKHNTKRHLNEYTSLDFEMGYIDGFEDIMEMETGFLQYTMELLKTSYAKELELLKIKLPDVTSIPRVRFDEAKQRVAEKYNRQFRNPFDLEPEEEVLIGQYFKEEYGSDFVFVTHYPSKKRPFYAMDDPADETYTLSFDLLFRGLEITTGGQRIHDYNKLMEKIAKRGMETEGMESYLSAFKHGMPPHGGLGIGLERLTMQLIGEDNVREATLFPRDLSRLSHRSQLLGLWRVRRLCGACVYIFCSENFKLVPTFPADRLLAGGMLRVLQAVSVGTVKNLSSQYIYTHALQGV